MYIKFKFTDCPSSFYFQIPYENHIKLHITSTDAKEKATAMFDLAMYDKKIVNNEIGLYQCLFCKFGTSFRGD